MAILYSTIWLFVIFAKTTNDMKAIELNSRTDKEGNLKIDFQLEKFNSKVRILILYDDESNEDDEELLWMQSVSSNPAFAFLASEEENIYSLNDGEPLHD